MTDARGHKLPPANTITIVEYRKTLVSFREQEARIRDWVTRYPVFLIVAGAGYCFERVEHVDAFLANLEDEIAGYPRPSV